MRAVTMAKGCKRSSFGNVHFFPPQGGTFFCLLATYSHLVAQSVGQRDESNGCMKYTISLYCLYPLCPIFGRISVLGLLAKPLLHLVAAFGDVSKLLL
jgi:hypothetical protein